MSIEIELHLESSDANEQTSRDLLNWLKREDIPDVRVQEKKKPPVEGQMGTGVDPWTIVIIILNLPQTAVAIGQIFDSIHRLQKKRRKEGKNEIPYTAKSPDDNIQQQIDAQREKFRQKSEEFRQKQNSKKTQNK
jgi:hypothetical protein